MRYVALLPRRVRELYSQIRTMEASLPHTETDDDIPLKKYDFRENYLMQHTDHLRKVVFIQIYHISEQFEKKNTDTPK
jgi:hypothetical protein